LSNETTRGVAKPNKGSQDLGRGAARPSFLDCQNVVSCEIMSRRVEVPPRRQVRRVAAWIYAVLNPIIDSLQRELSLLDSGNLTWRPQTGRCEMIRIIQEYVDPAQWPNYQDFLAEHPNSVFVPGFKQHDSELEKLNTVAQIIFSQLTSSNEFLESVKEALNRYESLRDSLGPQTPVLTHTHGDVPRMAAEYLINNAQSLPSHYLISAFWNSVGKNLLAFRSLSVFEPLHRSKDRVSEASAKLKLVSESYRLNLSRSYDVPAAPVSGISFEG
jgi:hypothetical protein